MLDIWEKAKKELKENLGEMSYDTWIAPLKPKIQEVDKITLEAPDSFFLDWVKNNYLKQISSALNKVAKKEMVVNFETNPNLLKQKNNKVFKQIKENFREEPQDSLRLNPRFTFDQFVYGPSNRMAHAASLAVANAPAKTYNPLFIYGGVGLGKTHLMQAIAHYVLSKNPKAKVKYTSSEKFTNELIYAIQHRTTGKFRQKYREIDVLLVDDIHFLGGKEAAQEEFFHTFNVLYDYHKQIVISSDRPPKEIPRLEERLVSRFSWGLIVDIQPPDLETRVAILRKKLENDPINIPEEVIYFIAENIASNIRELEGALIRVIAYSVIENKPITLEITKNVLKDMVQEIKKTITPQLILERIAEYFNVSVMDIKKGGRNKNIIIPRQAAMYLIRKLTNLSLPEIGLVMGAKHHTTILYANKKMQKILQNDKKIKLLIDDLEHKIQNL